MASSFVYISAKKHEILPGKISNNDIDFFKLKFRLTNEISSSGWIILAVPATGSIFDLLPGNELGLVADAVVVRLEEELASLFV